MLPTPNSTNLEEVGEFQAPNNVADFERILEKAQSHGAGLNNALKSEHLLQTALLSEADERFVLQQVNLDLTEFERIKAFRRALFRSF